MNYLYGFYKECEMKYDIDVFEACSTVFEYLPFGHIIRNKVFVIHGGLCTEPNMNIEELQQINRIQQPTEDDPLNSILWGDPVNDSGANDVEREGQLLFGPDHTESFLKENNLELMIRSHQLVNEGYKIQHNGKCITVFSAPNYVGKVGNDGSIAFVKFDDQGNLLPVEFKVFKAMPIPFDFQPMIYADLSILK